MMRRRQFLLLALSAGAFAAPFGSFAQQSPKVWRVGFLASAAREPYLGEFTRAMSELGYVEGRNLTIEWRLAEGKYERLPALATALVNRKPDVLVTDSTPGNKAAQRATTTI